MSSGHEWQFHIATDISWSRMAIGRSNPSVLTSSGQEWQFHIATVTSSGQEWQLADLSLGTDV